MFFSFSQRAGRHVVATAVVGSLTCISTLASAANDFAVTPAQLQSLGVALQRLEQPSDIKGQAYPAKVVLPPANEQIVSAPIAGLVEQILVGENDVVKRGQPLLRLTSPELGELQLKLLEATSKSRLAQKTVLRERQLLAEGIIPERRVQEAEALAEETRARVMQSEAALRLVGMDSESVKKIATGAALQAGVTVYAKTAGTVLTLNAKTGQRVAPADALLRLANTSVLWLDVQVPADRSAQLLVKGGQITVVGREAMALPMSVSPMVSDSQTVVLRAKVSKGASLMRPGEYVQVQVPFLAGAADASSGQSWPVPVQSVVRQDDKAYVFVRTATGFTAQEVTVVNSAGQSVQVQGPFKPGQEIATGAVIALKAAWLGKRGG